MWSLFRAPVIASTGQFVKHAKQPMHSSVIKYAILTPPDYFYFNMTI